MRDDFVMLHGKKYLTNWRFFILWIFFYDRKYHYTWVQYVWRHVRFVAVTHVPFQFFLQQSTHDFLNSCFSHSPRELLPFVSTILHLKTKYNVTVDTLKILKDHFKYAKRSLSTFSRNLYECQIKSDCCHL